MWGSIGGNRLGGYGIGPLCCQGAAEDKCVASGNATAPSIAIPIAKASSLLIP